MRGKSASYRVYYAYFPEFGILALFVAFGKSERSDISRVEARATADALKSFEIQLSRQFKPSG
jgi:hypothetical protein